MNKDNYLQTLQLIATMIKDAPGLTLCASYGNGGLDRILRAGMGDVKDLLNSVYVEFAGAGTNCTLQVELEYDWGKADRLDAEGNEWRTYTLETKVNWPCHGSTEPAVATARLNFYLQVVALANLLNATLNEHRIQRLLATAEELAERKAKQEAGRITTALAKIVAGSHERKGMRVGSCDTMPITDFADVSIPPGTHEVTVQGKVYEVEVQDMHNDPIFLKRVQ